MSWKSALRKQVTPEGPAQGEFVRPAIPQHTPDWARLVSLDLETYWDVDYTLKKISTSEYVRDPRFKVQMMGIKIGNGKTRIIPHARVAAELRKINWATHSLLCHNTQFDGFVLSHHYGIQPAFVYDSLAMARGLHSSDIGAGLDEVSLYYGGKGKIDGFLEKTKGVLDWPKAMYDEGAVYCGQDVDEMVRIFKAMLPKMPADEIELINIITKMFTDPVLKVDLPRVEVELKRELDRREKLMYAAVNPADWEDSGLLKGKEKLLEGKEREMLLIKRVIGSNEKFADLLKAENIEPPVKLSPAWMKLNAVEREARIDDKWGYAFAKDDAAFINLPNLVEDWGFDLNDPEQIKQMVEKQERLQALVDVRIAVKSTTNITRAQRFLTAGANGMSLPVGYAYSRAHTHRLGGNNKMNMQNLTRGGELRLSILAPKGHALCVQDSGQIEARVNGWLWGQTDLLDAFRAADTGTGRDAYCNFADLIYNREITKKDAMERFVGKVCVGPDTIVLTSCGLKQIIRVKDTDLLWDGEAWVQHEGLVDQGKRTTLSYRGLSATPDHEILTAHGWLEWQEVLTDPSLIQSALSSANLPSCDGSTTSQKTASHGGTVRCVGAPAEQSLWSMSAALRPAALRAAMLALRSQQAPSDTGSTGMLCRMTNIAHACLTVCRQQLAAVVTRTTRPISIMASEVFQCILAGSPTAQSSYGLSRLSLDGMFPSSSSIGSKTTTATSPATSGLQPSPSTPQTSDASKTSSNASVISKQTTQTYDLANAGPNRRFTVMTDDGPVVVHNCVLGLGFQMGAPKLQITLAKGALGGPPVYFTLNQCKVIINTYRLKNSRIKMGWDICKGIIEDMAAGRTGSWGPINWEANTLWLPNGMALKYPDLRVAKDEQGWDSWSYQSGKQRKKIYGGLLCENIVQALARIIVLGQTLEISRKHRVVMTTHDEAVALATLKASPSCIKFMEKCMRTAPAWCKDIPLNCEGGFAVNYSK